MYSEDCYHMIYLPIVLIEVIYYVPFLGHVGHLEGMLEGIRDQDIGDIFLAMYAMLYAYAGG